MALASAATLVYLTVMTSAGRTVLSKCDVNGTCTLVICPQGKQTHAHRVVCDTSQSTVHCKYNIQDRNQTLNIVKHSLATFPYRLWCDILGSYLCTYFSGAGRIQKQHVGVCLNSYSNQAITYRSVRSLHFLYLYHHVSTPLKVFKSFAVETFE